MAVKFTTTQQSLRSIKALVYGDAGAGKTVLCSTAPTPVIISAEKGLLSIAKHNIPVIEVENAADVFEARDFILYSSEAKHFQTICLDSVSDIGEVMLSDYKRTEKDPRQAYGRLSDDMGDLIRSFRAIEDRHVYVTAKVGAVTDALTNITKYAPDMPGNMLKKDLPYFFDEVFALRIHQGEKEEDNWRYLQTALDSQYIAKDRSGALDKVERPDLTYIFNKILGGQKNPAKPTEAVEPSPESAEDTADSDI